MVYLIAPVLYNLGQRSVTVARDLLASSGSIFVQIGDENVHRVRALMDDVFGVHNSISIIAFTKTTGATALRLPSTSDYIIWYAREANCVKYHQPYSYKSSGAAG